MRTLKLAHEESLYLFTLKAYRSVLKLADTDCRLLNSHLRRHALRLLEHVAASRRARGPRSRNRSLEYARLSLAKLGAVVDAIWCEEQHSDEQNARARSLLRRLELELDAALRPDSAPTDSPAGPAANSAVAHAQPNEESVELSPPTGDRTGDDLAVGPSPDSTAPATQLNQEGADGPGAEEGPPPDGGSKSKPGE